MFRKIMVPVDLLHADRLGKALATAADLARAHDAEIVYVAIAFEGPDGTQPDRETISAELDRFAGTEAAVRKLRASDHLVISDGNPSDVSAQIVQASKDVEADLIVLASHIPGLKDHAFQAIAGSVATHAPISVYVIR